MHIFQLRILAADHPLYEGECESLIFPGPDGQYGIEAQHSNFISSIEPGKLKYRAPEGEDQIVAVANGMIKVEGNQVLLLVSAAERPEDIDEARAKQNAEEARQQMLQEKSIREYYMANMRLKRALTRINVKETPNQ